MDHLLVRKLNTGKFLAVLAPSESGTPLDDCMSVVVVVNPDWSDDQNADFAAWECLIRYSTELPVFPIGLDLSHLDCSWWVYLVTEF